MGKYFVTEEEREPVDHGYTVIIVQGPTEDEIWDAYRSAWDVVPKTVQLSLVPGLISYAAPIDTELRDIKKDWLMVNPFLVKPARVSVRILAMAYEIENPAAGRSMIVEFMEVGDYYNTLPMQAIWSPEAGIRKGRCAYLSYNSESCTGGLTLKEDEPLVNSRIQIERIRMGGADDNYLIDGTNEKWPVTRIFRRADLIKENPSH